LSLNILKDVVFRLARTSL